ncbi:unnamed protein product [Leptidea sinapis]|uniref:Uncharacterized protein n=1 Tax=Leptidea sinapis TaxID=189913 RepID=A0A5E4QPL6_9NEOP|nr:unnamed protein product [Leptidea sinapis]
MSINRVKNTYCALQHFYISIIYYMVKSCGDYERGSGILGEPARWPDDLMRVAGKDWMRKTQDRTKWSKMEETFTQYWEDQG